MNESIRVTGGSCKRKCSGSYLVFHVDFPFGLIFFLLLLLVVSSIHRMAPPASYKGYNHQGKCRHHQLSSPVKNEIRQQLNLLNFVENESPTLFLDDDDEETTTVDNGIDLDPKIIMDDTETLNNNNNNNKPAGNEHKKSV